MIIKIDYGYDTGYIRCSAKAGRNINQLQRQFDNWVYDRRNNHPYWVIAHKDEEGNVIYGVCCIAEAFIYWLNHVKFAKGKNVARLIEDPNKLPKKTIRF